MPRLTQARYLWQRRKLLQLWLYHEKAYSSVSPHQQQVLHAFFVPNQSLSGDQLRNYRQQITIENPSLPQQAGHAFKALERRASNADEAPTNVGTVSHGLRVRSLLNPEISTEQLARAFWQMAKNSSQDQTLTGDNDTCVSA